MTWEIQQFQFQDLKQWHAGATKLCIIVAVKTTHKKPERGIRHGPLVSKGPATAVATVHALLLVARDQALPCLSAPAVVLHVAAAIGVRPAAENITVLVSSTS